MTLKKHPATTISAFQFLTELFPDEDSARTYIERCIWGHRPQCTKCGNRDGITPRTDRKGHWCPSCRRIFTVRDNTTFAKTKLPLRKWLYAIYKMQTARKGVSSLQLSKELGIT